MTPRPSLPAEAVPGVSSSVGGVRMVRVAGGGNCSSVGSVIDLLFVAGAVGGALLVAVNAALDDLEEARAVEEEGSAAGSAEGEK